MDQTTVTGDIQDTREKYNRRFSEFINLLMSINKHEQLFPKECRTCGTSFDSFSDYLCATIPKAHCWQDCEEVMGKPFTMIYRHCTCGNTLVLTLTESVFPMLRELWSMLRDEAEKSGKTLDEIVGEFSEQCDNYMFMNISEKNTICRHSEHLENND